MKNWIWSFIISDTITAAIVIANWMYCVYVEHWTPSNMSLDWPMVFAFEVVLLVAIRAAMAIGKKMKNKKVKYITMTLN